MKFAKVIDLENNEQVLARIKWEDEKPSLLIETDIGGIGEEMGFGLESDADTEKVIEEFTEEQAFKFRADVEKMING